MVSSFNLKNSFSRRKFTISQESTQKSSFHKKGYIVVGIVVAVGDHIRQGCLFAGSGVGKTFQYKENRPFFRYVEKWLKNVEKSRPQWKKQSIETSDWVGNIRLENSQDETRRFLRARLKSQDSSRFWRVQRLFFCE